MKDVPPKKKLLVEVPILSCSWKMVDYTPQGINISYLGKRKIILKSAFLWDMLVPRRVISIAFFWFMLEMIYSPVVKHSNAKPFCTQKVAESSLQRVPVIINEFANVLNEKQKISTT